MKDEERKKEDCELLYDFMVYSMKQERTGFCDVLNQFKADNDLLPKPRLEFNRWIVSNSGWMAMFDNVNDICYGIDTGDDWFFYELDDNNPNILSKNRYATEAEILEKLSAMADKLGYVEGVEVECLADKEVQICSGEFKFVYGSFYALDINKNFILVLLDGKWAKIIAQKQPTKIDKHIKALTKAGYVVTIEKK